jgi:hypothetical protein
VDGGLTRISEVVAQHFTFDRQGAGLIAVGHKTAIEYSLGGGHLAAEYPEQLVAVGFTQNGRHVMGRIGDQLLRWPDRTSEAVIARARRSVYRTLTEEERSRFALPMLRI